MQYDVFISCKSEDYKYAEEIYEFLEANGIHTFLASKELRTLGESEYRRAISAALKSAYHMVIFASQKEYIDSTWVYYEWDWFVNAKLKGFKPGQIVTVLKDVHVNDINADLWKYESFTFDNYKVGLLSYVETPAYLQRKERLEKKKEEEAHIKRQQEEQLNKQRKAKQELIALAEEYRKKVADLNSVDAKKLVAALRAVGIDTHTCPVCNTDVDVAKSYCPTCGWTISPIDDIEGAGYLSLVNEKQLEIARGIYAKSALIESVGKKDKKGIISRWFTAFSFAWRACLNFISRKRKVLGIIALLVGLIAGSVALIPFFQRTPQELYERGVQFFIAGQNSKAVKWYHKAAKQGYAEAQYLLGNYYCTGWVVEQNAATSIAWYHKAAEQGHPQAQLNLGDCYFEGKGIVPDTIQAVVWYRKAAEQGHPHAQMNMGYVYENGYGVDCNEATAIDWYRKAAKFDIDNGNNPIAKEELKRLHALADGEVNGHEYIDLGLSVKWATCNVGASSPSEIGEYFQGTDKENGRWGDGWRRPDRSEMHELIDKCVWRLTTQSNRSGYSIEGPNGNSIFLPTTANTHVGYYWTNNYISEWDEYTILYFDTSQSKNVKYIGKYEICLSRLVTEK